jgi:tellurite resistance protein
MGVLIVLGIIGFIVYSIANSNSGSANSKATSLAQENPFQVRLSKEFVTLKEGQKIEVLGIWLKGICNSGNNSIPADLAYVVSSLVSFSFEDSEETPVICAIEDFQHKEYPFFSHVSDQLTVTYGLCGGWDEWVRMVAVPIEALTFSRKGPQTIKLKLRLAYNMSGYVAERTATLSHRNDQSGYMDSIEQRERGKELAVSLAVLVAGIDGVRDATEAEIVTGFIRKQIAVIKDEAEQAILKQKLNKAAKEAHAVGSHLAIRQRGFEIADEAADFDSDIKFQIIELLLDVAGADNVAAKRETDFLNDLAHRMGLDLNEYINMRDKALPISIYESNTTGSTSQLESMLGITDAMSVAEKKAQLSKEYRKWNALKSSSNSAKSKQAKDMVKAIGELRSNL